MKKIFNIRFIVIFLALTMQISCSNYLELLPPNGLVREEFWKTKEDVEAVLMGAYQSFSKMDGNLFTYGEARGDMVEAHGNFKWSDEYKLMTSNIFPENSLCKWDGFYKVINYCNEVIKNAPEVKKIDNTFTDFQLKGYMAEAQFLRSLSYFYLVRLYKDVPLVLEPSENDGVDFYPHQTSGEEILRIMKQNLDEYRTYANDGYKTPEEVKGRATKASFDALLADISLWNFEYDDCIEYCNRITSDIKFQLMPMDKWFELYNPGNSLESIYEFQFNDKYNQKNSTYGKTNQYAYQYLPSQHAIELFAFKYAVEMVRGEKSSIAKLSEDNYIIWKFAGRLPDGETQRTGDIQNSCNWIVYRLADIHLMKAEALSQVGRYNEALVELNIIRERAGDPLLSIGNSPVDFEDAILNERALELAFEGKRWFDLLRMGRRNNYSRKAKLIELIIANVPSTQKRILSAKLTNPLGWYLPVYKEEIERNKNLVQNSYYIF
ncbi:MAG: RagB/SusD family nutrient uptake outer membrane protein [Candidatus Saccharibacteria bacterium]